MYITPSKLARIIPGFLFILTAFAFGQTPTVGTWYTYTLSGDIRKVTFGEDVILFEYVGREGDPKMTEKMTIEKKVDANLILVKSEKKSKKYALFLLTESEDGSRLDITPLENGNDPKALVKGVEDQAIPEWKSLMALAWYNEAQIEHMKTAPGMDELKRDDLLTSLQWREDLSQKLEAYFTANPNANSYEVYRFTDNYRNRKLVELGYNPYKRVAYNLQKQFKDDPEIIKLLTEEIKF